MNKNYLKIISLGGFGHVTKNMFAYETEEDLIIVDCGVGFPEEEMLGVDLVIPDISYILSKKDKVRAIFLSHGHDDHIGALPYVLPQISNSLPVFAPKWAKALIEEKMKDFGIIPNIEEIGEGKRVNVGEFSVEFVKVTHSIPDTLHLVLKTPIGVVYHAADFKLDLHPVMGEPTNQELIREIGSRGVVCLLSDCLRSENQGFTPPEAKLEEMFEQEIANCPGKFMVTTMSSNLSRLKQAIDVSLKHGRKIVLVGRSMEKTIDIATKLKCLNYSPDIFVSKKAINRFDPSKLTLLVAGSQGQLGSAMDRMVAGEIEELKIKPGDKVVFSTDAIPGNETAIYNMIDNIYRLGGEAAYADVRSDIHVSGHGAQGDLGKLMEMIKPKYLIPIGGNYRHMVAYRKLAEKNGFSSQQVLLKDAGEVIAFDENGLMQTKEKVHTGQVMVDALGVGDVGNVVLRDRKILSEEGIVVAILPIDQNTAQLDGEPYIISRGFVYVKENQGLVEEAKNGVIKKLKENRSGRVSIRVIRQEVQEYLEKFFFDKTGRRPMVLIVTVEV